MTYRIVERFGPLDPRSATRVPSMDGPFLDRALAAANASIVDQGLTAFDAVFGSDTTAAMRAGDRVEFGHATTATTAAEVSTEQIFRLLDGYPLPAEHVGFYLPPRGEVPAGAYVDRSPNVDEAFATSLNSPRMAFLIESGCSLVLRGAHRYFPSLGRLCRVGQRATGARVNANVYVCSGSGSGLGLHWDEHDVLVVQIEGEREWELGERATNAPLRERLTANGLAEVAPDRGNESVIVAERLQPGQTLFIPRGTWHRATGTGELSVHVSLGFDYPTGIDMMGFHTLDRSVLDDPSTARRARSDARRTGHCWEWTPIGLADEAKLWEPVLANWTAHQHIPSAGPIRDMMTALRSPNLDEWSYQWWGSEFAVAAVDGQESSAAASGRRMRFAPSLLQHLELLCSCEPTRVAQLTDQVRGDLPPNADPSDVVRVALCELMLDDLVRLLPPPKQSPSADHD